MTTTCKWVKCSGSTEDKRDKRQKHRRVGGIGWRQGCWKDQWWRSQASLFFHSCFFLFCSCKGRLKGIHSAQSREEISLQRRRASRETKAVLTSSQIIFVVGVPEGRQWKGFYNWNYSFCSLFSSCSVVLCWNGCCLIRQWKPEATLATEIQQPATSFMVCGNQLERRALFFKQFPELRSKKLQWVSCMSSVLMAYDLATNAFWAALGLHGN